MAMNKKEQAEMESLRNQLRLAKALRFTEPHLPDVPIPSVYSDGLSKGFLFCASEGAMRVEPACSSSVGHAMGQDKRTTTQGGRRLYSTELLAWQACRNEVEQKCAEWLAKVDEHIERLQAEAEHARTN